MKFNDLDIENWKELDINSEMINYYNNKMSESLYKDFVIDEFDVINKQEFES